MSTASRSENASFPARTHRQTDRSITVLPAVHNNDGTEMLRMLTYLGSVLPVATYSTEAVSSVVVQLLCIQSKGKVASR